MEKKEILVIGAGVIGTLIARELTKFKCSVSVFEKLPDVGWGVTKANSGIIHAGYGDNPQSVRARYCEKGNQLYSKISEELDVEFKRVGSIVAAFSESEEKILEELIEQGKLNGVSELEILSKNEALKIEPSLNPQVRAVLYAKSAGIVAPWEVAIAAFENSNENGAEYFFNTKVKRFFKNNEKVSVETETDCFDFDFVINASGLFSDEIAKDSGIESPSVYPRKGQYILLDDNGLVNKIVFPVPGEKGKGILVVPTVHDTTLLGPTAEDLTPDMKENLETTQEGILRVIEETKKLVPSIDISKTIRTFAGLRPENSTHDFDINYGDYFVNLSAIRSPGLTSAPAIAEEVAQFVKERFNLKKNVNFNPIRKSIPKISKLNSNEIEELIKKDSSFGRVICRCNKVTEGEVVEAIRRGAKTIDGVKFRTLATFGRCQGSFCILNIMKILSRELHEPINMVEKNIEQSKIINGEIK